MSEVMFKSKSGTSYTADKCPVKLLQWYATNGNDQQKEAAISELERIPPDEDRADANAPAQAPSTALAKAEPNRMQFVSNQADEINANLAWIAEHANLITPTTVFPVLPEGYEVQCTMVTIDPKLDCHEIDKKSLMLSAAALKRVQTALGVSWDPIETRRTDNRMQMDYWEYKAVGTIIDIDGRPRVISGTYELDLREGSSRERNKVSARELDTMRKFGLSRAETGAKSRAVSEMLKRSEAVGPNAWKKPIVCVRLIARRPVTESTAALYPAATPAQLPETIDVESDPEGPDGTAV